MNTKVVLDGLQALRNKLEACGQYDRSAATYYKRAYNELLGLKQAPKAPKAAQLTENREGGQE